MSLQYFISPGSRIYDDEASLGNSSEIWINSSELSVDPHFLFNSDYVWRHYSNSVANHTNNSAKEFSFDDELPQNFQKDSFLADAPGFEDLKISHKEDYRCDYEGLVCPTVPGNLTQSICRASLSDSLAAGTENTISKLGAVPNPTSSPETETVDDGTRRKIAHGLTERRYRENVNLKFLQLEEVLDDHHCSAGNSLEKMNQRVKRTKILQEAHENILQLREEVKFLKENLRILVQTAFPDTYKYVLNVG
ncbi:uncharacterized protein N7496_010662 [Penicillium cataractarum]|uniref:BHLH domain-containing protein n=1 Tax=Penicillium cataractarum TaxID=2100454 RepID=A0A9W9RTF1_9EURO|nr:uncharacterized protein N7496_010662 [Penicillium cataractarum]KAJ5364949.1 hypothetical protein N7496_010662 [Penicillium cataractarum]